MKKQKLFSTIHKTVERLEREFDQIPMERKQILAQLTGFVQSRVDTSKSVYLNFICTHNSRRSHMSQLWAQAAAYYFGIDKVHCFSGGTEATAFNPRAVKAMKDAGFVIEEKRAGDNPLYEVRFAENAKPILAFSKKYDDTSNPGVDFAAVMTCSHADNNCPIITGASTRIALTYDDPKDSDGSPLEEARYAERVHEIGRELLFAFSQVKPK